jgi:hypothetical protein
MPSRIRFRLRSAAVLAAVTLASCRPDEIAGPVHEMLDDLNHVFEGAQFAEIGNVVNGKGWSSNALSEPLPVPADCAYSGDAQRFVCAAIVEKGLAVGYSYELFDDDGRPQRRFDPRSTSSIRIRTTAVGANRNGQVDQTQDLTVTGLRSDAQTVNGTVVIRRGPSGSPRGRTISTAIEQVVLGGRGKPPRSGRIKVEHPRIRPDREHGYLVVFNGTCLIPLTHYTFYTATGEPAVLTEMQDLTRSRSLSCPPLPTPTAPPPTAP